jgi:nicotinamide phosphoribosyltransferase
MKLAKNIILNTDSYKVSMAPQYPAGTTKVYSYIASRGGKFTFTEFIGLQMFIKEYLTKPVTKADVDIAEESTNFARYTILREAGLAVLAQANTSAQSLLRLLE